MALHRRFEIREIMASGATGTVVLAWDRGLATMVALKVLRDEVSGTDEYVKRTRDEARVLSRLEHPSIVHVHELLHAGERQVVVMEALLGLSADRLLRHHRDGLPWDVALEAVRQAAAALDFAYHAPEGPEQRPLHVVHRDVKPSNLFFTVRGEVKLVDFGIAKADFEDREAVTEARILGSRGYLAPERMDSEADTPKGDVYALGLTLFELLTGKPLVLTLHPHHQADALARNLEYLNPAGLPAGSVPAVRGLVRSMCAYDPDERLAPAEVDRLVHQALERVGVQPDLPAFGVSGVRPHLEERDRVRPQDHSSWGLVSFLEGVALQPGLKEARAVLSRAGTPWWHFWSRGARPSELIEALRELRSVRFPADRQVVLGLTGHPDPQVARAARELLGRSSPDDEDA